MKTFVIDAPGKFSFGEMSVPCPAPGEVLLRIKRLGFCGSDLNTFRGSNPLVAYPRIPGHEIAAVVEQVAEGVPAHLTPGTCVTVVPYTTCGSCSACRAGRGNACRHNQTLGVQQQGAFTGFIAAAWQKIVPARLGLAELALVEPLAVGFHAASRGRVTPDDTVLVFGCGMIGLGAIAASALNRNARVVAVDIADSKLELAAQAGATHTINAKTAPLQERIFDLTGGHGPDVVIEAVGAAQTFLSAVEAAAFGGRVVYIGYCKDPVAFDTKLFVLKELDILGSRNSSADDFRAVVAMLESGRYPVAATITRSVPFTQAGAALAAWAANPEATTKIQVEL